MLPPFLTNTGSPSSSGGGGGGGGGGGNNGGGANDVPIILGMGQSNEIGGVETSSNIPGYLSGVQANAYIWWGPSSAFQQINAGINTNNNVVASGNGWATEMQSTYLLKTDYNKAIYYIKNAAGGQDIAQWNQPSGVRWVELSNYVSAAFSYIRGLGKNPYVLAITWRQGEADITNGTLGTYYSKLATLISAVRGLDSALANAPFIMMTTAITQPGVTDSNNVLRTLLNSLFYKTVYDNPTSNWVINADVLGWTTGDSLHFDPTSQIDAGLRVRNMILTYPLFNQSDPDATTYINAVQATGYTMSAAEKGIVRDYIVGLKNAGIWTKIKCRYMFIGNTAAANQVNLKTPGTFDLVAHGSWTYDAAGGPTGDNTSTYFGTGLHPSVDLSNSDLHLQVWCNLVTNHADTDMGCKDGAGKILALGFWEGAGTSQAFLDGSNTGVTQFADASGSCIFTYDGVTVRGYKNGVALATPTTFTPSGMPTSEFFIGGFNNNGTTDFGSHNYCMFSVGSFMSAQNALDDYNLTLAFLQAINRFRH